MTLDISEGAWTYVLQEFRIITRMKIPAAGKNVLIISGNFREDL